MYVVMILKTNKRVLTLCYKVNIEDTCEKMN